MKNHAVIIMDYFIGLMEYGNTPNSAYEHAVRLLERCAGKMTDEDIHNTRELIRRMAYLMEVQHNF